MNSDLIQDKLKNLFTSYSFGDKINKQQFLTLCKEKLTHINTTELKQISNKFPNELPPKDFEGLIREIAINFVREKNNEEEKVNKLIEHMKIKKTTERRTRNKRKPKRDIKRFATQVEFPNIIDTNIEQALKVLSTQKANQSELSHKPIECFGAVLRPRFSCILHNDNSFLNGYTTDRSHTNRSFIEVQPIFDLYSPDNKDACIEESEELKEFMEIEKSLSPMKMEDRKVNKKGNKVIDNKSDLKAKDRENVADLLNAKVAKPRKGLTARNIKSSITKESTLEEKEGKLKKRILGNSKSREQVLRISFIAWRHYLRKRQQTDYKLNSFLKWKSITKEHKYKKLYTLYKVTTTLKLRLRTYFKQLNRSIPLNIVLVLGLILPKCNNSLLRLKRKVLNQLKIYAKLREYKKELEELRIEFSNENPWSNKY